jgi:PAS domain S-box-containing protein
MLPVTTGMDEAWAGIGVAGRALPSNAFTLDVQGRILSLGASAEAYLGWQPESDAPPKMFVDFVHPEDRALLSASHAFDKRLAVPHEFHFRLRCFDATYRLVRAHLIPAPTDAGFLIWHGSWIVVDNAGFIAERVVSGEPTYHPLFEMIPQIVWIANADGFVEYFNRRWSEFTGISIEDACGKGWIAALHPDDMLHPMLTRSEAISAGVPYEHEYRLWYAKDSTYRWQLARGVPERNTDGTIIRWFGTCTDIDEQKKREQRTARHLGFLSEVSTTLSASLDLHATLDALLYLVVPESADWGAIHLLEGDGRIRTAAVHHADPVRDVIAKKLVETYTIDPKGTHGTAVVLRTGRPEIMTEMRGPGFYEGVVVSEAIWVYEELGYHSRIVVPLVANGQLCGTLVAVWAQTERVYAKNDLPFFEDLAARAAVAIANAQAYAREQRLASAWQKASLPTSLPNVQCLRFYGVYEPGAFDEQVGGDWYDAMRLTDGRIVVSIGDVAGSGLEAAVTMGSVRQIIRGIAYVHADPALMLDAADKAIRAENPDRIVTAFVGVLDPITLTFTYANAGHPTPIVRQPDGTLLPLEVHGLPLGLRGRDEPGAQTIGLSDGCTIVLYTDGLTEATHDIAEGERRLHEALTDERIWSAKDPAAALRDAVLHENARDDIAIMVVHIDSSDDGAIGEKRLCWVFEVDDVEAAHRSRHEFVSYLVSRGVSEQDVYAAELVFGELIGNVVRHAPGPIEITLDWSDVSPVLHVIDKGPGFQHIAKLPSDIFSENGRGLYLIASLTEDFHVDRQLGKGSHAWAVLALTAPGRQMT